MKAASTNVSSFTTLNPFCWAALDVGILLHGIGGIEDHQLAFLIFLDQFGAGPVFFQCIKFAALNILHDVKPVGLLEELVVGHHAIFHEQTQALPLVFKILSLLVEYLFEFVGYFFCDMAVDLFYIRIALQVTAADVQWYIRTVDHTMQQHQEFRNDVLHFVGNEYLVAVELNLVFLDLVALFDLREIEDAGQIKWIIYVEMDPE